MPWPDDTDHLNAAGLWCASHTCCAFCNKCDSCSIIIPGRHKIDFHSTPTAIPASEFCPKCTAYLRELDGEAKVRAAVAAEAALGGRKRPHRKPRANV